MLFIEPSIHLIFSGMVTQVLARRQNNVNRTMADTLPFCSLSYRRRRCRYTSNDAITVTTVGMVRLWVVRMTNMDALRRAAGATGCVSTGMLGANLLYLAYRRSP